MSEKARHLVVISAGVVALQAAIGAVVYFAFHDWATRGQFGDLFGVVNALFSGLAFAGLIYTVMLQREELALQREELHLTREELRRSATAQEQQEAALRVQAHAAERSAKLAATNYLLETYRRELGYLRGHAYTVVDPRVKQMEELERREAVLLTIVEELFSEISNGVQNV